MPDITMCRGGDCPMQKRCYRFTATPSDFRQAYFAQPPWNGNASMPSCGYEMRRHDMRLAIQKDKGQ